jgi:ABC-type Co2+ transport system permease subunit
MDKFLQLAGIAFIFLVGLPFMVYFLVLSIAQKKTQKEKVRVAIFSTLIFSLFIYEGYEASGFMALQVFTVIVLFWGVTRRPLITAIGLGSTCQGAP